MTITEEEFLHLVGVSDDMKPEPAPARAGSTQCNCGMSELHAIERDRLRQQIDRLMDTTARLEAANAQTQAHCRSHVRRWARVAWAGWLLAALLEYARHSA